MSVLIGGSALAAGVHGIPDLAAILASIEDRLDDPATDLAEIKNEVASIETKLDNVPQKWSHGAHEILTSSKTFLEWDVPGGQVAHFSITIEVYALDAGEEIRISSSIYDSPSSLNILRILSSGTYTCEFDGTKISVHAFVQDQLLVFYNVFATY